MKVAGGSFMIEWMWIGEGRNGEYDPYDPTDEELVRFDVYRAGRDGWELVEDGSYCTDVPAHTPSETILKLSHIMIKRLEDAASKGNSLKKTCEALSWINPSWVKFNGMRTLRN